ncbi:PIN domain-containing protein [Pseudomonas aeruginosa]|uniref:PIN domain-containing protein n=1 Tax=Pseudomonas aeruginosa TaxID=287 RepID=UPI00053E8197|nr:PIN domain-containing protein [Pseudomonas aeruginosa]
MSLGSQEIAGLVALDAPVLCVDTCTLLDVIRDITREAVALSDVSAGLALLSTAEIGSELIVLMAEQVSIELLAHIADVEKEAQRGLEKFQSQAGRIRDVAQAYGAQGALHTQYLDGHVGRARTVLERWRNVVQVVPHNDGVSSRAFRRVNEPRTPARRGKESMKDCVIIEAYLETAHQLRAAGFSKPVVFASSNTKEYFEPNTRHLPMDIASDLAAVQMDYAPNFGAAKHLLQL